MRSPFFTFLLGITLFLHPGSAGSDTAYTFNNSGFLFELHIDLSPPYGLTHTNLGEVTKYEPNRLMGVKLVGGCRKGMEMHADYLLTDLGDGRTRLEYTGRAEMPPGFFYKMMAPIGKLMGKLMIKKFMRNLKALVEQPRVATG